MLLSPFFKGRQDVVSSLWRFDACRACHVSDPGNDRAASPDSIRSRCIRSRSSQNIHLCQPFSRSEYAHQQALDFVGEDTVVPDDILRGVISLAGHGEIVTNPILNGSKALLTKMQHEFRKSFILAADEEMRKGLQEGKHERLPNSQRDHILRGAQKFKRLAQRYAMLLKEPRPGTSRSRGGDDDDDDDGRVGLEVHRVLMARSGTFVPSLLPSKLFSLASPCPTSVTEVTTTPMLRWRMQRPLRLALRTTPIRKRTSALWWGT